MSTTMRIHDEEIVVTMDSTSTSTSTSSSCCYDNKCKRKCGHEILHHRLVHQCGMEADGSQFQIVADNADSTDTDTNVDAEAGDGDGLCKQKQQQQQLVVVKSLVWTACCMTMTTTVKGEEKEVEVEHHHFVTVLPLEHHVNELKLVQIVNAVMRKQHQQQQRKKKGDEAQQQQRQLHADYSHILSSSSSLQQLEVKIISHVRLAKRKTAELLTGFKVGTIPPIGHAFPLRIFVDQSLSLPANGNGKETTTLPLVQEEHQKTHQLQSVLLLPAVQKRVWLSGGSGSLHHTLCMPLDTLVSYYGNQRWGRREAHEQHAPPTPTASSVHVVGFGVPVPSDTPSSSSSISPICWNHDNHHQSTEKESVKCDTNDVIVCHFASKKQSSSNINSNSNSNDLRRRLTSQHSVLVGPDASKRAFHVKVNGSKDDAAAAAALETNKDSTTSTTTTTKQISANASSSLRIGDRGEWREHAVELYQAGKLPMVKLKRRLCELAMRKPGRLAEVKAIVEAVGEHNFPQLMEPEPALSGKNALHMAAWTGDLETIQYLMEMGRRYNNNAATTTTNVDMDVHVHDHLDLVNVVSTGVGNYGKSPICYAITQDRDDVIQYLLSEEHNASVLMVNNKGQSVVSIAQTRLKAETKELLHRKEAEQMAQIVVPKGGDGHGQGQHGQGPYKWRNYRETHSDKRKYGDLDPRFGIDPDNDCVEIAREISNYRALQKVLQPHLTPQELEQLWPRSVLPTSQEKRKQLDSLARSKSRPKKSKKIKGKSTTVTENSRAATDSTTTTARTRATRKGTSSLDSNNKHKKEDFSHLPTLTLSELLVLPLDYDSEVKVSRETGNWKSLLVIDDLDGVKRFSDQVTATATTTTTSNNREKTESSSKETDIGSTTRSRNSFLEGCWGLDAEWRPRCYTPDKSSKNSRSSSPVALLQLSSAKGGNNNTFVIDLQELCQQGIIDPNTPMTHVESMLNDAMTQLFTSINNTNNNSQQQHKHNNNTCIVGFGIQTDLDRLAVSYPHMTCFHTYHNVIDLPNVIQHHHGVLSSAHNNNNSINNNDNTTTGTTTMSSLLKTVAKLLGRYLSKDEQCSDWQHRPLSNTQVEYAALDAAVLPVLLRQMMVSFTSTSSTPGDSDDIKADHDEDNDDDTVLKSIKNLRSSFRFTISLDDKEEKNVHPGEPLTLNGEHTDTCISDTHTNPQQQQQKHKCVSYSVPMTSVRTYMGWKISKQTWPSASCSGRMNSSLPPLPETALNARDSPNQQQEAPLTRSSLSSEASNRTNTNRTNTNINSSCKNNVISVYGLFAQLDDDNGEALPKVGSHIRGGKEGCIRQMLGHNHNNNNSTMILQQHHHAQVLPQNAILQYPRKSRVIAMENASLLFLICAQSVHDPKHARIEFQPHCLDLDGRHGPAGRYISSHFPATTLKKMTQNGHQNHPIFLFVQPLGRDQPFMFCGDVVVTRRIIPQQQQQQMMTSDDEDQRDQKMTTTTLFELTHYETLILEESSRRKYLDVIKEHDAAVESHDVKVKNSRRQQRQERLNNNVNVVTEHKEHSDYHGSYDLILTGSETKTTTKPTTNDDELDGCLMMMEDYDDDQLLLCHYEFSASPFILRAPQILLLLVARKHDNNQQNAHNNNISAIATTTSDDTKEASSRQGDDLLSRMPTSFLNSLPLNYEYH
jgi:hypothetical protein